MPHRASKSDCCMAGSRPRNQLLQAEVEVRMSLVTRNQSLRI